MQARLANGPSMSAWDGRSGASSATASHPFYGSFQYQAAMSVQDAVGVIALPEMAAAKATSLVAGVAAWGSKAFSAGEVASSGVGITYKGIVASVPGRVVGEFNQVGAAGPLAGGAESTFSGGRYALVELDKPLTLYRAWTPGQSREFGGFWSLGQPMGSLQARIDSALLPEWGQVGGTAFRSQATHYTAIEVPAGTRVFAGEVANQGGSWVGGGSQLLIEGGAKEFWKIGGGGLR
jgi:hypothetical protein